MTTKTKLVLLLCILALALILACGTANMPCYSQYPGCEATVQAIGTAAARP